MWPPRKTIISCSNDRERSAVRHAQLVLRLPITGEMDDATRGHIRGVQRLYRLNQTGCLDAATAEAIDKMRMFDA